MTSFLDKGVFDQLNCLLESGILALKNLLLLFEVIWTIRHLHEELLGNFTHAFMVRMNVVTVYVTLSVTKDVPTVHNMISWDVSLVGYF